MTRWVWTRAVARREDRPAVPGNGISTNVTERRVLAEHREELLAEQRQQVQRLRELDRMKDDLVALVSHELRNPIGTILGYAEIIGDEPGVADEVRRYSEVIRRHSGHCSSSSTTCWTWPGRQHSLAVNPRPLSLTRALREAVEDHRPAADAKGLTVRLEPGPHLTVLADPARLRQVLDNLLSNAVKYTPAGGTVTVATDDTGGAASSASATRGSASRPSSTSSCSPASSAPRRPWRTASRAPASAWPSPRRSSTRTTARSPPVPPSRPAPRSPSPCRPRRIPDILPPGDNATAHSPPGAGPGRTRPAAAPERTPAGPHHGPVGVNSRCTQGERFFSA